MNPRNKTLTTEKNMINQLEQSILEFMRDRPMNAGQEMTKEIVKIKIVKAGARRFANIRTNATWVIRDDDIFVDDFAEDLESAEVFDISDSDQDDTGSDESEVEDESEIEDEEEEREEEEEIEQEDEEIEDEEEEIEEEDEEIEEGELIEDEDEEIEDEDEEIEEGELIKDEDEEIEEGENKEKDITSEDQDRSFASSAPAFLSIASGFAALEGADDVSNALNLASSVASVASENADTFSAIGGLFRKHGKHGKHGKRRDVESL